MTKDAFDRLYREHGHAVLRRARRMLRSEEDARDVVQDVFFAIYKNPESFESRSSVATYLYAAATNACLNRIRNHKTRTRLVAVETAAWGNQATPKSEDRALACEILDGLSDEDAALAVYLYCDELTHEEIADLYGCSRRHVGDLATRLKRKIHERVASQDPAPPGRAATRSVAEVP